MGPEELYRMLVKTSPYCIVLCDLEGMVLMINGSGLALLGYTDPDEMRAGTS